jgi:16S rRNA (cytosine1402-N4)-methyltransferase
MKILMLNPNYEAMADKDTHIPVLEKEAVDALNLKPSSVVVDATLGSSGHAKHILSLLSEQGVFVGIDADRDAVTNAKKILKAEKCTVHLRDGNYRDIDSLVTSLGITGVDGILADLGWRMEQFGGNGKGFSFNTDEELIMTFGDPKNYPFTARDIVNEWREEDIKNVLKGYGEERFSGRIARTIAERRVKEPIRTTFDLVKILASAVPAKYRNGRIHPATRTFQALRIAVNDELETLKTFITKSAGLLTVGGRLVIISFHSLEDRIVKHSFRDMAREGTGVVITKKPITALRAETVHNTRSRSAKLRIFEKT